MARALRGLDSAFLAVETPAAPMHLTAVAVLEPDASGPADADRICAHLAPRLRSLPVFRRHLREVPFGLDHPVWVERDVDLDAHLHRLAVPSPGGASELCEVVAQLAELPLDRARPLWALWVLEGLEGGHTAVVAKVHHALIDGLAGVEVLARLLDTAPDAPAWSGEALPTRQERAPSSARLVLRAARSLAGRPVQLARRSLESAAAVVRGLRALPPPSALRGADRAIPLAAPGALGGAITERREVAFGSESLETLRRLRRSFDVKLNDVLLAVCAGALRRYLMERDALPDAPLVAAIPVSLAAGTGRASGNRISTMLVALPVHLADPVGRLASVRRASLRAKRAHGAVGGDLLSDWAQVTPPGVLSRITDLYSRLDLADRHRPVANLVVSNVPGPERPLYCAGYRLRACHPLGPIYEGCALNLTVLSQGGRVHLGLTACPDVVPDVARIARALGEATSELCEAAERSGRSAAARAPRRSRPRAPSERETRLLAVRGDRRPASDREIRRARS